MTVNEPIAMEDWARAEGLAYSNDPCPVCGLVDGCHNLAGHGLAPTPRIELGTSRSGGERSIR